MSTYTLESIVTCNNQKGDIISLYTVRCIQFSYISHSIILKKYLNFQDSHGSKIITSDAKKTTEIKSKAGLIITSVSMADVTGTSVSTKPPSTEYFKSVYLLHFTLPYSMAQFLNIVSRFYADLVPH